MLHWHRQARYQRRPLWPFRINLSSPQMQGLAVWYPPAGVHHPDHAVRDFAPLGPTRTKSSTLAAADSVGPSFDNAPAFNLGANTAGGAATDYVSTGYLATSSSTVMCYWAKFDSIPSDYQLCGSSASNARFFVGVSGAGSNQVATGWGTKFTGGHTLPSGITWNTTDAFHIAMVVPVAGSVQAFVNGRQCGTTTTGASFSGSSTDAAQIGGVAQSGTDDHAVDGLIWDFRIYDGLFAAPELLTSIVNPATRYDLWMPLDRKRSYSMPIAAVPGTLPPAMLGHRGTLGGRQIDGGMLA